MRQAARTDGPQKLMVAAFRGLGASVEVTSGMGHGFPDLVVGVDHVTVPVEIKDGAKPLTPDQVTWHRDWRGSKAIIRKLDDCGLLVKAIRGLAGRFAGVWPFKVCAACAGRGYLEADPGIKSLTGTAKELPL